MSIYTFKEKPYPDGGPNPHKTGHIYKDDVPYMKYLDKREADHVVKVLNFYEKWKDKIEE